MISSGLCSKVTKKSNSQRCGSVEKTVQRCGLCSKVTKMRAIHNMCTKRLRWTAVVAYVAKLQKVRAIHNEHGQRLSDNLTMN